MDTEEYEKLQQKMYRIRYEDSTPGNEEGVVELDSAILQIIDTDMEI